ncbi:MAG: NAD(+)/NADH kinase, partial [Clostridia bacterium]
MKKVMIHPNPTRDYGLVSSRKIAAFLQKSNVEVTIPEGIVDDAPIPGVHIMPFEDAICGIDMVVSVGGDGSILHTARQAAVHKIPILGVNVGRMGYMAELECGEFDYLGQIISGNYTIDERMMLNVEIMRDHEVIYTNTGLNDVVVAKTNRLKIIDLDIYADKFFISHYQGDGVVIATPTGSTAYSMSAGGPIVDPQSSNLTITPVCTHSLSAKPVVLSPKRV